MFFFPSLIFSVCINVWHYTVTPVVLSSWALLCALSVRRSNYLLSVAEFSSSLNRNDRSVCRCGGAHVYMSFGWVQRC